MFVKRIEPSIAGVSRSIRTIIIMIILLSAPPARPLIARVVKGDYAVWDQLRKAGVPRMQTVSPPGFQRFPLSKPVVMYNNLTKLK